MIKRHSKKEDWRKPKEPTVPLKVISKNNTVAIDGKSLKQVLESLPAGVSYSDVYFVLESSQYGHNEPPSYYSAISYCSTEHNLNYENDLEKYNKQVEIYKQELEIYKQTLKVEKLKRNLK